ncbi:hypothetical protein CGZ80_03570 [Rhodopirellula sp. MGV]|nr:hypothetical protein CGZ80_03570 [Rhodopirellula sp. MGV]PNY36136.1 hypothetical protein C2E31_14480 [Rhodopirellula baltica]
MSQQSVSRSAYKPGQSLNKIKARLTTTPVDGLLVFEPILFPLNLFQTAHPTKSSDRHPVVFPCKHLKNLVISFRITFCLPQLGRRRLTFQLWFNRDRTPKREIELDRQTAGGNATFAERKATLLEHHEFFGTDSDLKRGRTPNRW